MNHELIKFTVFKDRFLVYDCCGEIFRLSIQIFTEEKKPVPDWMDKYVVWKRK